MVTKCVFSEAIMFETTDAKTTLMASTFMAYPALNAEYLNIYSIKNNIVLGCTMGHFDYSLYPVSLEVKVYFEMRIRD